MTTSTPATSPSPAATTALAASPDETVNGAIEINSLQLEFPDGVHQEGDDDVLYAALANTGQTS